MVSHRMDLIGLQVTWQTIAPRVIGLLRLVLPAQLLVAIWGYRHIGPCRS